MDPNALYKQSFRALTEKLGRVPDTRDKEWWEISETLRKGWSRQRQTSKTSVPECAPTTSDLQASTSVVSVDNSSSATDADTDGPTTTTTRERSLASAEAVSGPGITAEADPDRTTEEPGSGAGSNLQPVYVVTAPRTAADQLALYAQQGARGPAGGILATCVTCSRVWERPKSRGRPSFKCGECR